MKISLRKADALAKATLEAARKVPLESTVSVSVYSQDGVATVAEAGRETLRANLKVSQDLMEAAYQIRALIGEANRTVGIDSALTTKAKLDAREKVLSALVGAASIGRRQVASTDLAVAEKQREVLLARVNSESYNGYGDTVGVSLIDDSLRDDVQKQLADIRKEKIAIADRLLELNLSTKVTIDPSVVETLTAQSLI